MVDGATDEMLLVRDAAGARWPIAREVYAARAGAPAAIARDYPALAREWAVALAA